MNLTRAPWALAAAMSSLSAAALHADRPNQPDPTFDLQEAGAAEEPAASGDEQGAEMAADTQSSFLLSDVNALGDPEILWPGFLTGMRATTRMHQKFAEPLGNPLYFESPFVESQIKGIYLWHDFPKNGQIGGGQVNVWAVQIRAALTDRLALIATKDGWSELNAGILPEGHGWNDAALGLKYAVIVDEVSEFVLTPGMRWEWHNGDREVLQGGDAGNHELSPFVSFAKGWDRFHCIGTVNGRLPMDHNDGNYILSWDLHFDYEVAPETLPGFFPLLEIHALHYLSDADVFPVDFGGLDYTNLGSADVAGDSVFWGDLGFRWKLTPNLTLGAAYGFPISDPGNDIFNQRVTVDLILGF